MKKIFAILITIAIFISACSPSSQPTPSKSAPPATQVPATATATEIPPTSTFTPTPTLSLPVSKLTSVPSSNTKITAENVESLQEIARYYSRVNYFAKVTKDNKFLFILDPEGLTKYDYSSMETLSYISLASSVSDLKISNDGNWVVIDNNWLLDFSNAKEPKIHILSDKIDLLNRYYGEFSLSPDGSIIAVQQYDCSYLCNHQLQMVSTQDFKVLYISSGVSYQTLPVFSPDGKYFAIADRLSEADSQGNAHHVGASVSIWSTNDFTKISTFSVNFPFVVTNIAFSEESNLIAVAQTTSVDIYDFTSGDLKASIPDLCFSYDRSVIFSPPPTVRLLVNSDCGSGEWIISGSTARLSSDNVPDLSKIVFDEKGNFKSIPYPQPISDFKPYEWSYFKFSNDDVLSFKNRYGADRYSCDLVLTNGLFNCLGEDVILATDGKYYSYVVGNSSVDIYSSENPSQIYYSIPFRNYIFELLALDPINNLVIYNVGLSVSASRVVIQDMTNDRILEKWEGETFLSSIVISENKKFAALCRTIGYTNRPNKDKLLIFDLSEKRTIYNTDFTCGGAVLGITDDGSKLATEYYYLRNPSDQLYSTTTMTLNTTAPYEKQHFDIESTSRAVAFSPDASLLVIACSESEICFLDPSDGKEIFRLKAHSGITNLAFSKDGSTLATSSDWGLIRVLC